MGKPQVTLTFAGDSQKLEQAFGRVGESARGMATDVGSASTSVRDAGAGFDRAAEGADNAEGKAQGFASTLTGTKDTISGFGMIARGELFEGFVTVGQGAADLAEGFNYTVIPAVKALATGFVGNAAATVRATVATGAHRVATLGSAAATTVMTVAQKGLNLAMRANPIGLVITALFAIGAAFVAAYKNSETFRKIVTGAINGVRAVVSAVGSFISGVFRRAFGAVRTAWNATVGGKGFSVPDWVPIIGGKTFRIPRLHTGGIMPGAPGSEGLALLQAGERVTPAGLAGAGGRTVIEIRSGGSQLDELLVELLARAIRVRGGDVQLVLGGAR